MTVVVKDALAGIYKNKKEIITIEEHNKLLKRIDQLEHTIKALEFTNLQLAEAIKGTKPPQKGIYDYIY